jgi:hypothetical protein
MKKEVAGSRTRYGTMPSWFAPWIEKQVLTEGKAESLAKDLFSLDEPWRERFLDLVANLATHCAWDEGQPTWEDVTGWLGTHPTLYQRVRLLLSLWCRSGDTAL